MDSKCYFVHTVLLNKLIIQDIHVEQGSIRSIRVCFIPWCECFVLNVVLLFLRIFNYYQAVRIILCTITG